MIFAHSLWLRLVLGAFAALFIALAAYRYKLLTFNGSLAAFVLGSLVFGLGGLEWSLVLIVFFLSSSGLSSLFRKRKTEAEENYAKSSKRDYAQVLANGGVALFFVIIHALFPQSVLPWIGFVAAFAAANADTWATELGVLDRRRPVLIVNGKSVPPGTSGAVSVRGTLAACGGALLIGMVSFLVWPDDLLFSSLWMRVVLSALIFLSGLIGSLVDSLLGATLQAIYYCSNCQKETEKHPTHGCGTSTRLLHGWKWIGNDWVNLFCTLSASGIALILGSWVFLW
ncbi:MAG: DUF92 domain-containing protein [Chloroflexi bacterium]|nr:DUF92 domain-containing protein [Chloroflexota bacterium]